MITSQCQGQFEPAGDGHLADRTAITGFLKASMARPGFMSSLPVALAARMPLRIRNSNSFQVEFRR